MAPSDQDTGPSSERIVWSELFSAVLFGLFAPFVLLTGRSYPRAQSKAATVVIIATSIVVYIGLIVVGLVVGIIFLGADS